jgi:hypothetical protein
VLVEERGGLVLVGRRGRRDARRRRPLEAAGPRPARDDTGDLDVGRVDQRLEVGALA